MKVKLACLTVADTSTGLYNYVFQGFFSHTFLHTHSCPVAPNAIVDSSIFFEVSACASARLCLTRLGSLLDTPALVPIILQAEIAMKHVAALLLAQLGGNATPSAEVRCQSR